MATTVTHRKSYLICAPQISCPEDVPPNVQKLIQRQRKLWDVSLWSELVLMKVKTQTRTQAPAPASGAGRHLSSPWFNGGADTRPARERSARELPWGRSFLWENLHMIQIRLISWVIMGSLCHCRSRGGRDALSNESCVHQETVSVIHRKVARLWRAEQTPSFPYFLSSPFSAPFSAFFKWFVLNEKPENWFGLHNQKWVLGKLSLRWRIFFRTSDFFLQIICN